MNSRYQDLSDHLDQVEDAIEIWRDLAKIPSVSSATICSEEAPGHVRIHSQWTERDLEHSEKVKFARSYMLQLDVSVATPPVEIGSEIWNVESPSGKQRAVVRNITDKKGREKQYVEIWNDSQKINTINVTSLDRHGKIYEDRQFGCFSWSHSETHILYVAEKKPEKLKSFFDRKAAEDIASGKDDIIQGEEHVYRENWGEQLSDKFSPVLCVLDVESGCVTTMEHLPEHISPGQAVWCPEDDAVLCVGWWNTPYKLGLIYCPIRRSAIFHVDLKGSKCDIIGRDDQSVSSPQFSPDNKRVVFLENRAGGPHHQCRQLSMIDWSTKGVVPVVEIVKHAKDEEFQGIYSLSFNPSNRSWAVDSRRLVMDTVIGSKGEVIVIDSDTGKVTRLTNDPAIGIWTVWDVHNDLVLASHSSVNQPERLVVGQLPAAGSETNIKWIPLDVGPGPMQDVSWKILKVPVPQERINSDYKHIAQYESILVQPAAVVTSGQKTPLILFPHGGPHVSFTAGFAPYVAGFCRCGYSILLVNYRGSSGFGQDSIDSLPGHVGTQDVQDVYGAMEEILKLNIIDENKKVVFGGSHGGFLTAHLIGQYPDSFNAAICRNPVINLASMLAVTDIPDWCCVEAGLGDFDFKTVGDPKIYEEMWKRSPIRYVDQMKTPLMIMLGANDVRVPTKQGHELRRALQARGIPVKLLCYADNDHPINKVEAEADAFVNVLLWYNTHTA